MPSGRPQPRSATRGRHSALFYKTTMCKFHSLGRCRRGGNCVFAHTEAELRKLPDFSRTQLCQELLVTGVCNTPGCSFAHQEEELRPYVARVVGSQLHLLRTEESNAETVRGHVLNVDARTDLHGPAVRTREDQLTNSTQAGGVNPNCSSSSLPKIGAAPSGTASDFACCRRQLHLDSEPLARVCRGKYQLFSGVTSGEGSYVTSQGPMVQDSVVRSSDRILGQKTHSLISVLGPPEDARVSHGSVQNTSVHIKTDEGDLMRQLWSEEEVATQDNIEESSRTDWNLPASSKRTVEPMCRLTTDSTHCDEGGQLESMDDLMDDSSDDDFDDLVSLSGDMSTPLVDLKKKEESPLRLLIRNTFFHVVDAPTPLRKVRSEGDICRLRSSYAPPARSAQTCTRENRGHLACGRDGEPLIGLMMTQTTQGDHDTESMDDLLDDSVDELNDFMASPSPALA